MRFSGSQWRFSGGPGMGQGRAGRGRQDGESLSRGVHDTACTCARVRESGPPGHRAT